MPAYLKKYQAGMTEIRVTEENDSATFNVRTNRLIRIRDPRAILGWV